MSSLETSDPLKQLERVARHRAWVARTLLAVLFATLIIVGTAALPPRSEELVGFAITIGILSGFLVAWAVLMDRFVAWGIRRLSPWKPYVREAGLPWLRGPTFVLNNGLVVTNHGSGVFLTMFFDPEGSGLHPHVDEALHWHKRRNLRLVSMIGGKRGPPAARADLERLQAGPGASMSFAAISELKPEAREIGAPRWVVSAYILRLVSQPRADRLAAELDAIESFLRNLLRADTRTAG